MKIAVVGAGAMGSVYAGLLGDAGNEVWAVDIWKEHIEAIHDQGLRVEGKSGDRTVRIKATIHPEDVGTCDLIVIATKAMHVESAARSIKSLIGVETSVLTIQNGLGSFEKVAAALGEERVTIGVAGGFGASIKGPAHVHHNGMELIRLGELNGPVTPRLLLIESVWSDAGFNVKAYDDIKRMVWEKLICNVCFSGICTVSESQIGQVLEDSELWKIAKGCAEEAYKVALAKGIRLSFNEPVPYVLAFGQKMPRARPSMLLDHIEGRGSEIEAINGAIVREGTANGVPTPFNSVITSLVLAKESKLGLR